MKKSKKRSASFDGENAICSDLSFAASEAYKMLRTNVQYGFPDNDGCKVIGITSSERNEGKSTLAINLAYMLSCDKERVILIEGDMRLPSISKKLDIDQLPGLSDYLAGRIKGSEGIKQSEKAPGLSIICAGVTPPNPSELIGSARMDKLLSVLKEHYDFIIIDLPPVNIVSDPLSVAKYLDGFIVVVRSEYSTRQGVADVVNKLGIVNAKILGFVINESRGNTASDNKYGKYGKYGRYGRYAYSYSRRDYAEGYEIAAAEHPQKKPDENG